jgi:hypothetical protein
MHDVINDSSQHNVSSKTCKRTIIKSAQEILIKCAHHVNIYKVSFKALDIKLAPAVHFYPSFGYQHKISFKP